MIQDNSAILPPQNTPVVDRNFQITIPWMGLIRALFNRTGMGTGIPFQVQAIALAPADNNQQIIADWVVVTIPGGAMLSPTIVFPDLSPGEFIVVQNHSAFAITVQAAIDIDNATSYSLAGNKMQIFWQFSTTQIFSTQLG